jgi:hypothetical protein
VRHVFGIAARRHRSAVVSVSGFETIRIDVLAHLQRIPDPAVHRDVHARRQRPHCADGGADVVCNIRCSGAGSSSLLEFSVDLALKRYSGLD